MSLKAEQRIAEQQIVEFEPCIYTTGAYLTPMWVMMNDEKTVVWVVDSFNDDTYFDRKNISPLTMASSIEELMNMEELEDNEI